MGSKVGSAAKVKLNSFDDLFGGTENTSGSRLSMRNWRIYIHSKDTHSVSLMMKRWRKPRRVLASTVCLFPEL